VKFHIDLPDDDTIDFTPWINGVFLIVFFFMIASLFLDEAPGYAITVPTGPTSQAILEDEADRVSLSATDEIWYRDSKGEVKLGSFTELEETMRQRQDLNRPVLLRGDRQCRYEQMTRLKNALRNAGVVTIFEQLTPPVEP